MKPGTTEVSNSCVRMGMRQGIRLLLHRCYCTTDVAGSESTRLVRTLGATGSWGADPSAWAASASFCCMRRVSSFWRSGATKVYSPVISRSRWPAIFDASIALPPTCCRQVILARRNECGPGPGSGCRPFQRLTVAARAITAQLEAAAEIHWSWPCGKPPSKYGWKPMARVGTCQEPSGSWAPSRKRAPF